MNLSTMEHTGALSIFYTENASFQMDVTIPGVLAPEGYGPPMATPLPTLWAPIDKADVNWILASFQPTDPKPLAC